MSNARDKANIPSLNFSSTGIDDNATSTAITIDSSENVGIGTAFPNNYASSGNTLVVGSTSGQNGITIVTSTSETGSLQFADGATGNQSYQGRIRYDHSASTMSFHVNNGSERMRIDSSGNVGIGTSSPSAVLDVRDETNGANFIVGGSGTTNITKIGGGAGDNLQLFTNSTTPVMLLSTSGNVGIGTSSPSVKLQILGTENSADTQAIRLMENTTQGGFIKYDGNVNELQLGGYNSGENTGIRIARNDATTYFNTNGSERMRIDSSGRIGIGTTSPYYQIDNRFDDATTTLSGGSSGNYGGNGIRIQNNNTTAGTMALAHFRTGDNADWHIGNKFLGSNNSDFIFFHEASEVMRIDGSTGRLGIGTSSPEKQLTVASADFNPLLIKHTNGGGAYVAFMDTSTSSDDEVLAGAVGNAFNIHAGNSERMRITSSGNVGIGNTAPVVKLHVGDTSTGSAGSTGKTIISSQDFSTVYSGNSATTWSGLQLVNHDDTSNRTATGVTFVHRSSGSGIAGIISTSDTADRGDIRFITRGSGNTIAERVIINNDGNVGIGTSSPTQALSIASVSSTPGDYKGLAFQSGGTEVSYVRSNCTDGNNYFLTFGTFASGLAERMRIASDGVVGIGTSSPSSSYRLSAVGGTGAVVGAFIETTSTDSGHEASIIKRPNSGVLVQFLGSGQVGSITTNGSTTTYGTSSDYRLKENVVDLNNATERLKQLQPKRFNFISDADTTVDGFIAHEVSSVVPEAIHGTKDEVDANGNPKYQNIDQSKLVPLLVKTIQELEARITTLEANNP